MSRHFRLVQDAGQIARTSRFRVSTKLQKSIAIFYLIFNASAFFLYNSRSVSMFPAPVSLCFGIFASSLNDRERRRIQITSVSVLYCSSVGTPHSPPSFCAFIVIMICCDFFGDFDPARIYEATWVRSISVNFFVTPFLIASCMVQSLAI